MGPLSLALGAVGLGMQIFGGISSAENAQQQAAVSQDIAKQEQSINTIKQQAMVVQARRTNLESIRNAQVASANATAAATSQNAQYGSGLKGGLAQITDQSLFNMQGVNQAVQTGTQIAGINNNISSDKEQLASLGGTAATDQAITSLGGTLLKIGPTEGNLTKGINFGSLFS